MQGAGCKLGVSYVDRLTVLRVPLHVVAAEVEVELLVVEVSEVHHLLEPLGADPEDLEHCNRRGRGRRAR